MNLSVSSSGYHGAPHLPVLPSVATTAYNQMNYITNGTGGKFENSKNLQLDDNLEKKVLVPCYNVGSGVDLLQLY
ncbi:hypothetical protein RIF29_03809 [Crotalaria pallida]|uniref:Uncharacterized protein n=1 Tax=Crotalaria pallida TaxID=3830 RepID=A0AAN9J2T0_CROPI